MFDEKRAKEVVRKAEALKEAGDMDGMKRVLQEGMAEATEAGLSMSVDQIQSVADFVQQSVKVALLEIVEMADHLGTDVVPVEIIRQLSELPATGATQLWVTIEELGTPIDYGVPDDLSELEDLL